jgi:hypothetical protein
MDMKSLAEEIARIDTAANKLLELADEFPAVAKNAVRILASVRMLQINVNDFMALSEWSVPGADDPRSTPRS